MIDFNNARWVKLGAVNVSTVQPGVAHLLMEGEQLLIAAKGTRDYVVFTDKRIIAVNIQGLTGSKKDFSSLPLSKIQAFSVETAGTFDRDCELEMWFSGLGMVRLEFAGNFDIGYVARLIGSKILV
jgi:Bacterial PH domain